MILSDLLGSSVAKTNVLTLRLKWMPQALCQHAAKFHQTKKAAPTRTLTSHPLCTAATIQLLPLAWLHVQDRCSSVHPGM
jgi:uncharacterized radical SAM superfamily Fe-S cluster-containing enzyme